jgi:hypothetical protein
MDGLVLQTGGQCVAAGAEPTTRTVELGLFFLVGVFGTGHCLGMCGPLVSVYADRMNETDAGGRSDHLSGRQVRQHLLFNAGRVVVYTLLGGLFGLFGLLTFASADAAVPLGDEVRAVVGVAVGTLVVATGAGYLRGRGGGIFARSFPAVGGAFRRVHGVLRHRVDDWVGGPRIFGLGFLHGFLPCPLLYPAFLYAFGRADPVGGALSLFVLGLGTFPALSLYGSLLQSVRAERRRTVHRLLGGVFLLLGTHTLLTGLRRLVVDASRLLSLPAYLPLG